MPERINEVSRPRDQLSERSRILEAVRVLQAKGYTIAAPPDSRIEEATRVLRQRGYTVTPPRH